MGYLDNSGLSYFWSKIKSFVSAATVDKARSIPYGTVKSTSTSTSFTSSVDGITSLQDGVCVYLKNGVVNSASGCTLNINSLGAKPMYLVSTGDRLTTEFTSSLSMLFVYNSTRISGGCWDAFFFPEFVTYYTGSSTPASSLGKDGDIYLKT